MSTVEVITPESKAYIPRFDSPETLRIGIDEVVKPGINEYFDDALWAFYYDTAERMKVLADPAFNNLLDRLGADSVHIDETSRPNIMPHASDLVRGMASSRSGRGGGFIRTSHLDEHRYILAPAHEPPEDPLTANIELDLSHGISFSGSSLVGLLSVEGIEPEVINYRPEPAFPAYRCHAVGSFFVQKLL